MNRILFIIMASAILLSGCKSKEEKAAELIKDELSKTLYDFDSYQPIETIVIEAKANAYNDSACWRRGAALAYGMQKMVEYINQASEAKDHMDIWGEPSYYSSSYSDRQYYKYKRERDEAMDKAQQIGLLCKNIASEIKDSVSYLDTTMVIGWEVSHRFRCKTRGGNSTIGDYRYIIDKDFKNVLLREDLDDDDDKHVREAIESALSDFWETLTL